MGAACVRRTPTGLPFTCATSFCLRCVSPASRRLRLAGSVLPAAARLAPNAPLHAYCLALRSTCSACVELAHAGSVTEVRRPPACCSDGAAAAAVAGAAAVHPVVLSGAISPSFSPHPHRVKASEFTQWAYTTPPPAPQVAARTPSHVISLSVSSHPSLNRTRTSLSTHLASRCWTLRGTSP